MANRVLIVFVYPVLFLFSVLIQYLFILGELYHPKMLDQWLMWTIIASICGNMLGIALVAWLGRFSDSARLVRPARLEEGRNRRR